jgi:hypothetical protein
LTSASKQESGVIEGVLGVINSFDSGLLRAEMRAYPCCLPGCKKLVFPASALAPACSDSHKRGTDALVDAQGPNPLRAGIQALGRFHLTESIQASSWKTYATGIRHCIRFRLGVQRRHPCQIIPGSSPMDLEHDAEESLIEFVEWISLAGSVAPTTA